MSKHFVKAGLALFSLIAVCLFLGCSSKTNEEEGEIPGTGTDISSSSGNGTSSGLDASSSDGGASSSSGTESSSDASSSSHTESSSDTSSNSDISSSAVSSSSRTVSSSSGASSSSRAASSSGISSSSRTSSGVSSSSRTESSSSGAGGGAIDCSRAGLEAAVDNYLAAMNAGDHTLMPLTSDAKYYENDHDASYSMNKRVDWGSGLWAAPIKHDRHMNLIDVDSCATYTEIIVANQTPQYLNGARLKVKDGKISEVWLIVTQSGDWGFNATNYLRYAKEETEKTDWKHNWSEIPVGERLDREELRTAGNAYLEYFSDKTVEPMWGVPCARLEGGMYTGSQSNGSCDVGVPNTQKLGPFYNLVDVDKGMVVAIFNFGGADSHWFRIVKGHGYRYIHTLTAMKQSDFQP